MLPMPSLIFFVGVYRCATLRTDTCISAFSATGVSRFTQCDYVSRLDYLYSMFKSALSTSTRSHAFTISILSSKSGDQAVAKCV